MDAGTKSAVEREVRAAFDAYEAALAKNDLDALKDAFRPGRETVRMMTQGGLYGRDAILAFRQGRQTGDLARDLTHVQITALSPDLAVAAAEYRRRGSGRCGGQSQTWLRENGQWRIAAAHVSLGPPP